MTARQACEAIESTALSEILPRAISMAANESFMRQWKGLDVTECGIKALYLFQLKARLIYYSSPYTLASFIFPSSKRNDLHIFKAEEDFSQAFCECV